MKLTHPFPHLLLALTALAACGGAPEDGTPPDSVREAGSASVAPSVSIVSPADGSFQEERSIEVVLSSTVPIVPAGDTTPGTAHHHLYLDADLGDTSLPVPTVPGSIVHLGDGSRAYTFEEVASGPHRIIAVLADGAHVPLRPLVTDTVELVVE